MCGSERAWTLHDKFSMPGATYCRFNRRRRSGYCERECDGASSSSGPPVDIVELVMCWRVSHLSGVYRCLPSHLEHGMKHLSFRSQGWLEACGLGTDELDQMTFV